MNEQWNKALDQVKDEYLSEAAGYRRKRYWPGVAAAAAAVLVLAVGWSVFKPSPPPVAMDGSTGGSMPPTEPPDTMEPNMYPPDSPQYGAAPGEGFWDWLLGGNVPTEQPPAAEGDPPIGEAPAKYEKLHFYTYREFQATCTDQKRQYLHSQVPAPLVAGEPMTIEKITVFEQDIFGQPWVWYYVSSEPYLTVRVPTVSSLTEQIDPNTSGAEVLRQIWPNTPNLHNKKDFAELYSEIREVQITTAEGVKAALLRRSTAWDKTELIFLQNGTLVMIVGNANAVEGDWLETFSLVPIDSL